MKPASKFAPYDRRAFLAAQPAAGRALAQRLCDLLESAFASKDISIYAGFPIVVRDMEWIAGFAMRAAGPVAYCCSPATLAAMGAELKPYMSGKSCVAVKPRKGESIDVVLELVGRAFALASRHGGMISQRDAKLRERQRTLAERSSDAAKPQKPAATANRSVARKKRSKKVVGKTAANAAKTAAKSAAKSAATSPTMKVTKAVPTKAPKAVRASVRSAARTGSARTRRGR